MRTRSTILAGVAGLAVAAFAGSAVAQSSWGNSETTYFHSAATNAYYPARPNPPSYAPQPQPGDMMNFRAPHDGSGPGVMVGPDSIPDVDE